MAGYTIWGGDEPDSAAGNRGAIQSGSGNAQADGNGNCVIQGGTSNSCQVGPTTAPPLAEPLSIKPRWPTMRGCDSGTEVAALAGGPGATSMRASQDTDVRVSMVAAGGASYGAGHLYLDFTVLDDSTIEIQDIKPIFFPAQPTKAEWIYTPQGGCGDSYSRVFNFNLDKHTFADAGVMGSSDQQAAGASVRREPLGPAFHVSAKDPAQIRVDVTSCRGHYEWGLVVKYLVRGEERTWNVGTAAQPYRSIGILSSPVPSYTGPMTAGATELNKAGTSQAPFSCH